MFGEALVVNRGERGYLFNILPVLLNVAVETYMRLEANAVDSYSLAQHTFNHVIHSLSFAVLPLHVEVIYHKNSVFVGGSGGVEGYFNVIVFEAVAINISHNFRPVGIVVNISYFGCVQNLVAYVPYVHGILVSGDDIGYILCDSFLQNLA